MKNHFRGKYQKIRKSPNRRRLPCPYCETVPLWVKIRRQENSPSFSLLPTFHFLPPPYIFAPISHSSLLFRAISPSFLLCTDWRGKKRFIVGFPLCNMNSKVQILGKSAVLTVKSRSETLCGNLPIRENLVIAWPYTKRASEGATFRPRHRHM